MTVFNATLNGTTAFSAFGNTYSWSNPGFSPGFELYDGNNPAVFHSLNLRLVGADWFAASFRLTGDARVTTTFIDADAQSRDIGSLNINGNGGATTITLNNTQINTIRAGGGDGNVTLTTGQRFIEFVGLESGNNLINVGAGNMGTIDTGDGNDRLNVGAHEVDSARLNGGTNTVTIGNGGQIEYLNASDGTNVVSLTGDARILTAKMDFSVNTLTTQSGNVESYFAYQSTNTLNIGTGGVQQIVFAGNVGIQTVVSQGWIGSLQSYGTATSVTLGAGGATMLFLSSLADTVRQGAGKINMVSTWGGDDVFIGGSGELESLNTGAGNDRVQLGTGRTALVHLGDGNDTIQLGLGPTDDGPVVRGGLGIDTADFSRIGGNITFTLEPGLNWQLMAPGRGYVALTGFENLTGGALQDRLTGAADANILYGGAGNDTLSGLAGADLLDGGANDDVLFGGADVDRLLGGLGNDKLTGGTGTDTLSGGTGVDWFLFNAGDGVDRITDFQLGVDKIDLLSATSFAQLTFSAGIGGARVFFGGTLVTVDGMTIAQLDDPGNFLF
jgi:hypothetical protein